MRKFLSSAAGATFHEETPNLTLAVRKTGIEIIYKAQPSMYVIVNLFHAAEGKAMLFISWGNYFDRMQNPQAQVPQIKSTCPTLYKCISNTDEEGIKWIIWDDERKGRVRGFGYEIPIAKNIPLLHALTPSLYDSVRILINKNFQIYNELYTTPPFPAWKTGLQDLWE